METPYIISEELDALPRSRSKYINSNALEKARESLDADLRCMGKRTEWVAASELSGGLRRLAAQSSLPVVSLEEVYSPDPDLRLGISRGVDKALLDAGYTARSEHYKSVSEQLDAIAALGPEVQLVDDVIFSGDMMKWVIEELDRRSVHVKRVLAGIAIQEGVEALSALDVDLDAVRTFSAVEDEICERDLFLTKGSGRRIVGAQMNALYFDTTNGKPEQWASLQPEYSQQFFINSLERSLKVLQSEVAMTILGQFYGYPNKGTVGDTIRDRLSQEERK